MSCRLVSLTVTALLLAVPAGAQFVVIDPGNLAQAILIADRTLQEYDTLIQQYQTILWMAQGLGSLDQYRMPVIGITAHDPGRWPYGAPWLQGLNAGDARGTLYEQTARRLERPGALLDQRCEGSLEIPFVRHRRNLRLQAEALRRAFQIVQLIIVIENV